MRLKAASETEYSKDMLCFLITINNHPAKSKMIVKIWWKAEGLYTVWIKYIRSERTERYYSMPHLPHDFLS